MTGRAWVARYLAVLGVPDPGPPSVGALRTLQAAHLERVPYENLDIHLGRAGTVDPHESVARIVAGRGGYCFHLNGALGLLLEALGYRVVRHRAWVRSRSAAVSPSGELPNHLGLTVHGLPAPVAPDGGWLVDVGLGDGPREPLPLRPGSYRQGPFSYALREVPALGGGAGGLGWHLGHDPAGSFAGVDMEAAPARTEDFAASHTHLSTSPESGFVRVVTAQRRDADGVHVLRGRVLERVDSRGVTRRDLDSAAEWFGVLSVVFGLVLDDLDADQRAVLWQRVSAAHGRRVAARDRSTSVPRP